MTARRSMTRPIAIGTLALAVSLGAARIVSAQETPPPAERSPVPHPGNNPSTSELLAQWQARGKDPAMDARFKVRIMEGVLEKAVTQAVLVMNQQLRRVSPDLVQLTGAARARGYRLESYGLFFEVEVPAAMRQTMGWTVRMMRETETLNQALGSLRRVATTLEGKERTDAELAVRQIELHVRPPVSPGGPIAQVTGPTATASPGSSSSSVATTGAGAASGNPTSTAPRNEPTPSPPPEVAPTAPAEPSAQADLTLPDPGMTPVNPLLLQNPDLAYEVEVREALITAMLEYGGLLPIGPDEWLAVAARDNQDVIIPGDLAEVVTVIMRVKGSDLADFKAGRLGASEIRKRVQVGEF